MIISLIVAVSENNIIGSHGNIPWKISADLKYFKEQTLGKTIIVGRKTFESLPKKPLPGRKNIVITRDEKYLDKFTKNDLLISVNSLEKALELVKNEDEVFIAGGGEIYKEGMALADKLYITRVHKVIAGDVSFPKITNEFLKISSKDENENEYNFTYEIYERKK